MPRCSTYAGNGDPYENLFSLRARKETAVPIRCAHALQGLATLRGI